VGSTVSAPVDGSSGGGAAISYGSSSSGSGTVPLPGSSGPVARLTLACAKHTYKVIQLQEAWARLHALVHQPSRRVRAYRQPAPELGAVAARSPLVCQYCLYCTLVLVGDAGVGLLVSILHRGYACWQICMLQYADILCKLC
jgi:hypothetical protein